MNRSKTETPLVMFLDDDPAFCRLIERWLNDNNFQVRIYQNIPDFLSALPLAMPDVICLDIGLPDMNGIDVFHLLRRTHRTVPVIFLTGQTETDLIVEAIQQGAYDYITKPVDRLKLVTSLHKAVEWYSMATRISSLEQGNMGLGYKSLIGKSPAMLNMYRQIEKVAHSEISVLITGESGTGKELVAKEIHNNSVRKDGPLISVNCAAITDTLEESEFFGHEKGAFTGAHQQKPGVVERAHLGTLFLDEVAELGPGLQAKLLRVLQEHQFERVGGVKKLDSDFRLICATNRNLYEMATNNLFRQDLRYRIAVMEIEIPPLRERGPDVDRLINALLAEFASPEEPKRLDSRARAALNSYSWPGNVRELQNVIQRAVVIAEGDLITLSDLPQHIGDKVMSSPSHDQIDDRQTSKDTQVPGAMGRIGSGSSAPLSLERMTLDELEKWAIETAMQRKSGHLSDVAKGLGIGRTTLYRKLKKYGMQ